MQWAIRGIRTFSNTVSYQSIKLYIPFSWKKESKASVRGKKGLISSQKCKIASETTSASKHGLSLPSCLASTSVRKRRSSHSATLPAVWMPKHSPDESTTGARRHLCQMPTAKPFPCTRWQQQALPCELTIPPSVETRMVFPGAISSCNFIIYSLKQTQHNT